MLYENELITFTDLPEEWKLIGGPEFVKSVYKDGVHQAISVAKWEGKYYLVGGNRRCLSWLAAREKAQADGTYDARPWLHKIRALIYHDMPPDVQKARAILENEERSDNPLHTFLIIHTAQQNGDWDAIIQTYEMDAQAYKKATQLENLHPDLLELALEGRMAKGPMFSAAKLPLKRQEYLLEIYAAKKPGSNITQTDIKTAKLARVKTAMQQLSTQLVPTQAVVTTVKTLYLVGVPDALEEMRRMGVLFDDWHKAFEEAQASYNPMYRLDKVGK